MTPEVHEKYDPEVCLTCKAFYHSGTDPIECRYSRLCIRNKPYKDLYQWDDHSH